MSVSQNFLVAGAVLSGLVGMCSGAPLPFFAGLLLAGLLVWAAIEQGIARLLPKDRGGTCRLLTGVPCASNENPSSGATGTPEAEEEAAAAAAVEVAAAEVAVGTDEARPSAESVAMTGGHIDRHRLHVPTDPVMDTTSRATKRRSRWRGWPSS